MRFHPAASAASHALARIAVAVAITGIAACSDRRNATSGDDAALFSLDLRNSRNVLALAVRDSSLAIGDTASIVMLGTGRAAFEGSTRSVVRFKSTDTTIVSVDVRGLLRAKHAGQATVFVRTQSGIGAVTMAVKPGDAAAETPAPTVPSAPDKPSAAAPPAVVEPPGILPVDPGVLPSYVAPQLPQIGVDVSPPASPTRSIRVAAGDDDALQAALNNAVGGDEIVLPDGASFTGSFRLPNRASGGVAVLRSSTVPVPAHTRMTPSQAGALATLVTNSVAPALSADDGAHGWRVVGIKLQLADNTVDNYGIVTLGSGNQTSASQFPRNIVLDRVYVNGSPTGGTSRCVSLNGISLAVVDSWLAECHAKGRDAQAVGGWTGTGPLLIENSHLEGSGQAIMFGGGDPLISGVTPADITIRRNHLYKPLSWAGRWTVKAAFELKNAVRVLFEGNVIENHWTDAQVGFAILIQAVNQDGRAPWSTVRDVTMRQNAIRNSRSGVNLLSRLVSSAVVTDGAGRILLRDNSFENVGRDPISGAPGRYVQLLDDLEDVTIMQNTFFGSGASNGVIFDGKPLSRLALTNNVFANTTYGLLGSGFGEGLASLAHFAPGGSVGGNVFPGVQAQQLYGTGNAFPSTLSLTDFVDAANGNYTLRSSLAFSVQNGARTGVDGSAILTATTGVTAR